MSLFKSTCGSLERPTRQSCKLCDLDKNGTTAQTLLRSRWFWVIRNELKQRLQIKEVILKIIVALMLRGGEQWNAVPSFFETVIRIYARTNKRKSCKKNRTDTTRRRNGRLGPQLLWATTLKVFRTAVAGHCDRCRRGKRGASKQCESSPKAPSRNLRFETFLVVENVSHLPIFRCALAFLQWDFQKNKRGKISYRLSFGGRYCIVYITETALYGCGNNRALGIEVTR